MANDDWYTLVIEPRRVIAIKVDALTAAEEFVRGGSLVLASEAELIEFARERGRSIEVRKRVRPTDWALYLPHHEPAYSGARWLARAS